MRMNETIPTVTESPGLVDSERETLNEVEFQLLKAGAKARTQRLSEVDRRYWLRWIALLVGLVMLIWLGCVMTHLIHHIFFLNFLSVRPSFAIAALVAPMASMTAITIVLFVAAFRKFNDGDDYLIGGAVADGARSAGLMN